MYYILPALTATSENDLCCIPPFSAPVRYPPSDLIPNQRRPPSTPAMSSMLGVFTRCSIGAVALGGTVTVIDVDMRFEWIDEMLRCQKFILRPEP